VSYDASPVGCAYPSRKSVTVSGTVTVLTKHNNMNDKNANHATLEINIKFLLNFICKHLVDGLDESGMLHFIITIYYRSLRQLFNQRHDGSFILCDAS